MEFYLCNRENKMKILITGHKGLIGKNIYNSLSSIHEVDGFDVGDKLKNKKYGVIIHCASQNIIRDIIKNPELAKQNIDITFKIFEFARKTGCKKLIIFSSSRLNHENTNPYTVSKKFLEDMSYAYNECYNIKSLIIRPETIWGKGDNPTRVIPTWIKNAKKNRPLIIYGDFYKELSPLHINNFMVWFLDFFDKINLSFIICLKLSPFIVTGQPIRAYRIAKSIIDVYGSRSKIVFKKAELSQPQKCDINRFKHIIKQDFEEILRCRM